MEELARIDALIREATRRAAKGSTRISNASSMPACAA